MRTTETCSAFLDVSMGRSFPNIKLILFSTNPSKSSSVCCHLPLQTCQTLTNHSFNIPRLLGTHCPNAEWVCDLLDIKSKYALSKNQFQFFFLLLSSKIWVSFSPSCCVFLHSLENFLPISLLLFNYIWSFDRSINICYVATIKFPLYTNLHTSQLFKTVTFVNEKLKIPH